MCKSVSKGIRRKQLALASASGRMAGSSHGRSVRKIVSAPVKGMAVTIRLASGYVAGFINPDEPQLKATKKPAKKPTKRRPSKKNPLGKKVNGRKSALR
jgi:hypothetical protein